MASITSFHGKIQKVASSIIFIFLAMACQHEHAGISDLRVGTEGNGKAFAGLELPVTAHVSVHAPIVHADVEIQPISGEGWTFQQQYTGSIAGKTHAQFETGIAVSDTAETGDYILVLRITDAEETVSEDTARFRLAIDSTVPTASDLDVGINAAGDDLHLESELTAPLGIAQVVVEIKGDDWEEAFTFSQAQLVGQLSYRFHEHVKVGEAPKGPYAIRLTVEDSKGRRFRTEDVFTK